MAGRVRVFVACSLDGFIAGPGDDLSWLPSGGEAGEADAGAAPPEAAKDPHGYQAFFAEVGALLMGRGTFDVVERFPTWPYEDRPVLVATHRPLGAVRSEDASGLAAYGRSTVRAVEGEIGALVQAARGAAGGADVYVDGGHLIRQALDAGLVDEATVTFIPVVLGAGHPLFAGVTRRCTFSQTAMRSLGQGIVQMTLVPSRA